MAKKLRDPFWRMLERKSDLPFGAAQAYAGMKMLDGWEGAYLQFRALAEHANQYRALSADQLKLDDGKKETVERLQDYAVEQYRNRLFDAEQRGRHLFRAAIISGRLHLYTKVPGKYIDAETSEFVEIRLEPPKRAEWVNEEGGAGVVINGFAAKTYLDRFEYLEWLAEVANSSSNEPPGGGQKKPKRKRKSKERDITLKLLNEEYGAMGTIKLDSPETAARKIKSRAYDVGLVRKDEDPDKVVAGLTRNIRRYRDDGYIADITAGGSFGQ